MSKFRALMLAVIGVFAIGYVGRSVSLGVVNAGGKGRDFFVTFADNPGVFIFTVIVIALIGVGSLAVAWRTLTGKSDE